MTNSDPYRLHKSLGYQLSVVARLQERRLDEGLKQFGLTRITWCVLLAVGNEQLKQPSDIAAFIGIDRTATSRALRQMEAKGMVAREAGTGDRRTTHVRITQIGRDLLERGTPLAVGNNEVMESKLSPDDLETLKQLLVELRVGEDIPLERL